MTADPSVSTKFALDRTRLAYERTLMAWVRAATSLIRSVSGLGVRLNAPVECSPHPR